MVVTAKQEFFTFYLEVGGEQLINTMLFDIPNYAQWNKIEKIHTGFSDDTKYYIEDNQNRKLLLRINSIEKYDDKKKDFEILKKFNQLDFEMSQALDFGVCNNGKNVYLLLSWIDGETVENVIGKLDETEQYQLGIIAGKLLKTIHSLPVEERDLPKKTKISKKLNQLQRYENSAYRVSNDESVIQFVKDNIGKMCRTKPTYEHGDFHIGNLIYTQNKKIGIIDFNSWECGDRYEEFYKIQIPNIDRSIPFSIGQLHGYFDGEPSIEFWETQAVYVAHSSLCSIEWASQFGQTEINNLTKYCLLAFEHYGQFKRLIPTWYTENSGKYTK